MKKFYFLLLFSSITIAQAQVNQINKASYEQPIQKNWNYYHQKSNAYKAAGFVMLGTGLSMALLGKQTGNHASMNAAEMNNGFMLLAGTFTAAVSFPLFKTAAKNKNKADILLGQQRIQNLP